MNLVIIYGPPGVGKLSTAREVARLTGYKLFDNHVSIRCAESVFDFGTEPFWRIVGAVRDLVFEEAAANGVSLIFTFVYSHPQDLPGIERRCASFESHGGRVLLVRLTCDREELERRLPRPDRAEAGKLASVETFRDLLTRHDLFSPIPDRESLEVDNTTLAPEEVAAHIVNHYHLPAI